MPSELLFTVGCARSGKSTFANKWVREHGLRPRAIVCSDDIRLALHGKRFEAKAEPMVWAIHTYMAKALLTRGHDVLIDGTNTTRSSIRRILEIDRDASYVLIDTPKEECQRRAIATGQADLVPVIERMSMQLEEIKEYGIAKIIDEIRGK